MPLLINLCKIYYFWASVSKHNLILRFFLHGSLQGQFRWAEIFVLLFFQQLVLFPVFLIQKPSKMWQDYSAASWDPMKDHGASCMWISHSCKTTLGLKMEPSLLGHFLDFLSPHLHSWDEQVSVRGKLQSWTAILPQGPNKRGKVWGAGEKTNSSSGRRHRRDRSTRRRRRAGAHCESAKNRQKGESYFQEK